MSNIKESDENIAFHPGYYLADIIEDSRVSKEDFADRLGESPQTIRNLIDGKMSMTEEIALGSSVELWMNLQKNYDEKVKQMETE